MAGRGGARSSSGPPADPTSLRQTKLGDWIHLPIEGRPGDPPTWPLTDATEREFLVWTEEWKRPQATEWEKNGQQREVALYVRAVVKAERPKALVAERTLVRQLMDDLGVSLVGMRRHRWLIDEPQQEKSTAHDTHTRPSAKDRFKVVEGGRAAS